MDRRGEEQPGQVPEELARPSGDVRSRWSRTEPSVWTERMLTALENGVKGGKWFSLVDKVWAPATLLEAFYRVEKNGGAAGVDRQTTEMFGKRLGENLARIHEQLRSGTYEPAAVRRVYIDKPGSKEKRPLGIPTVRDRVVQNALRFVLEPIFEKEFAEHSYGFRPGRGCKDALRRVDALLKQGYTWVVDADLKRYFDTIPHDALMERVMERVSDGGVLALLRSYLQQGVLDGLSCWTPEEGTPQGAVISPLLSNIYLNPLDHRMASLGFEMVRYADDFVVLCRSAEEARRALEEVGAWSAANGLTLHPEKTRLVDATLKGGFDFLGYHFERGYRWPSRKSEAKLKEKLRPKTKRNNGHSMQCIIADVNRTAKGWFAYFKQGHHTTFPHLDGWIRGRLRSILRKRSKRKGRGRGSDHQRWPNAYFAALGFFSMQEAWAAACQSARR
jgi:RNA-directed DNA polymerase